MKNETFKKFLEYKKDIDEQLTNLFKLNYRIQCIECDEDENIYSCDIFLPQTEYDLHDQTITVFGADFDNMDGQTIFDISFDELMNYDETVRKLEEEISFLILQNAE